MSGAGHEARIGLLINPIAGMGGRVGLKGTDGADILEKARQRGAVPLAQERAAGALIRLASSSAKITLLTGPGMMGEAAAKRAGFEPVVSPLETSDATTPLETRAVAQWMLTQSADLILFVGGDGTARDIFAVIADRVPLLGVPAGVKMHSAVFGASPRNAGDLARLFAESSKGITLRSAEVMDLDEEAIRQDRVSAKLYGYAISPYDRALSQNAKSGARLGDEQSLEGAAREIAEAMEPGCLYLLGPGTSTLRVAAALDLESSLLGVDAVLDGKLVGSDLDEQSILRLMDGRLSFLIVGVLGGQGSLFGRGNQQISAEVIRKVGWERIIVLSTLDKLLSLQASPLRVDTGDAETDAMLSGYIRVRTGRDRTALFRVQA